MKHQKFNFFFRALFTLVILLGLLFPAQAPAYAATTLTVTPITWNVIGLDSNLVTVGPNHFPIGARVCNTGASTAIGVTAAFVWDTTDTYINIRPGTSSSILLGDIPSTNPDTCVDAYFEVEVTRNSAAYNHTAKYHIAVSADSGATTGSTPTPRELLVEHLISQNRNAVTNIQLAIDTESGAGTYTSIPNGGTMDLQKDNTYWIKMTGFTATQGYEQIENFVNFPNTIFQVLSASTTYTADTTGNYNSPLDKLYGDGCTWENDPTSANYRSCLSTGKSGGNIEITYKVKIISAPVSPLVNPEPLSTLIYDFSGSSYHYNADFSITTRYVNVIENLPITKSFSPTSIQAGGISALTIMIANPYGSAISGLNVKDVFPTVGSGAPGNMTLADAANYTNTCGGTLKSSNGTSPGNSLSTTAPDNVGIWLNGGSVAAKASCAITVYVTAPNTGTYNNTTNNLFIGTADTGHNAAANLVVTSTVPPPSPPTTCANPTTLATWTLDNSGYTASASNNNGPFNAVTYLSGLTTYAGYYGAGTATNSGLANPTTYPTSFGSNSAPKNTNTTNSWGIHQEWPAGAVVPTGATAPYFEFRLSDVSKYGGYGLYASYDLEKNWSGGDNWYVLISADAGYSWSQAGTGGWKTKAAWMTTASAYPLNMTTTTAGITDLRFRIIFSGAQYNGGTTDAILYLDDINITGCERPNPPTVIKQFSPASVTVANSVSPSTLQLTIANPNSIFLTGLSLSDYLPITELQGTVTTDGTTAVVGSANTLFKKQLAANSIVYIPSTPASVGGTLTVTQGGKTVTGTSSFAGKVVAGSQITINSVDYTVASVSGTTITLARDYRGSSSTSATATSLYPNKYIVSSITDDTHLTLTAAPPSGSAQKMSAGLTLTAAPSTTCSGSTVTGASGETAISLAPNALSGTVGVTQNSTNITTTSNLTGSLPVGSNIYINGERHTVAAITSANITLDSNYTLATASGLTIATDSTVLSFTLSVTKNSATATASATPTGLAVNDVITIAGARYKISAISGTTITLNKVYAGTTASGLTVTKAVGLAGSATCTITATVMDSIAGTSTNISRNPGAQESSDNANSVAAANLDAIMPPIIEKQFAPDPIKQGGVSTLTFLITNPNQNVDLTGVTFTDTFPSSPGAMTVYDTTIPTNTCGGTIQDNSSGTLDAGDPGIKLPSFTLAKNSSCSFSVHVTASIVGTYPNTTGTITSTNGGSGNTASDTLTVYTAVSYIELNKQVSKNGSNFYKVVSQDVGSPIYYRFTVYNSGETNITSITVSDSTLAGSNVDPASCTWSPAVSGVSPLLPGDETICTTSALTGGAVAGMHTNTATATGNGSITSDPSTAKYNSPGIATILSAEGILTGGTAYDTATLSGVTSNAGGTVTYTVYTNSGCSAGAQSAGTKAVTNGVAPNSDTLTFSSTGTYYWQAVYSGDANNVSVTSVCTSEILSVGDPATIGETVWLDLNGNGLQDSGEPGVKGVTVNLLDSSGNPLSTPRTATTDDAGHYSFANVVPGSYIVEFIKSGASLTTQGTDKASNSTDSDADTSTGRTTSFAVISGQTNNGIDAGFSAANLDLDDLPDSYKTNFSPGPAHILFPLSGNTPQTTNGIPAVWLGTEVSIESNGKPNTYAQLDTFDDGLTLPTTGWTANATVNASVRLMSSVTGADTNVSCRLWIDWTNNGSFDDNYNCSGTTHSPEDVSVVITVPSGFTGGDIFIRVRDSIQTITAADYEGTIINGEVEGYWFKIDSGGTLTPVTLSYFTSRRQGKVVNFDWSTATETGNVGFNLYVETGAQKTRINSTLIPSQAIDSLDRHDYFYSADAQGNTFYIEDVDILGETRLHGPFKLGQEYGDRLEADKINQAAIQKEHDDKQAARQDKLKQEMSISAAALQPINKPGKSVKPTATIEPMATGALLETKPEKPTKTEKPTATTIPTKTEKPTVTLIPTKTEKPTKTGKPTATPIPTGTSAPTVTLEPTANSTPTGTTEPTATLEPTAAPISTGTSAPTATLEPTSTPTPTGTTEPTATLEPTATGTSEPTATLEPTAAPIPTDTSAPTATLEPTPSADPQGLLTTTFNFKVRQTGIYRVTYEMLQTAGLDLAGVPGMNITLINRGQMVPVYVNMPGETFGVGSFIEFYGTALDTIYTDTNIYTLQVFNVPVANIQNVNAEPSLDLVSPASYTETLTVNNQRAFANYSPGAEAWYDTEMLVLKTPKSWNFPFQVDGLSAASPASLELIVWGITDWSNSADHHLLVSVNGAPLDNKFFGGLVEKTFKITLPAGVLREGANTLTLTLPADTGFDWDMISLDKFSVSYQRAFRAKNGQLTFTAAGQVFNVTNLPSANIVAYRMDAGGTVHLNNVQVQPSGSTFTAVFAGTGQVATYLVTTTEALRSPLLEATRLQVDLNHPAQYLIISHPDFIAGLQPLVEARQAQGLTVSVVDVTNLYTQYSNGIFDPQAIKQYIAYAAKNLGTQYVLLVGGDTYDYRNYLGRNSISFIPSLYVATGEVANFVPADPLYADLDGNNVPDLAIGRFPARTRTELDLIVKKTLAYAGKSYGRSALFASDITDGSTSFKDISQTLSAIMPNDWTVENIHLNDVDVTTARTRLIAAMNRGTALVTFTGHSGPQEWTFSNLFNIRDAAALTNTGKPFVVVQWGCWNTYYVDPIYNYLVQSLLLSGDRGAAAVLGATTLADSESEQLLGRLLTPRLVTPGMTLGQALQLSKSELAQTHPELLDVLLGWSLMGDPALVIQP